MRIIATILAALALASLPSFAQSISADASLARDDRLIKKVDVDDIKAIAAAAGHTIDSVDPKPEAPMVVGKTSEGYYFVLVGKACELEGYEDCLGLSIEFRFDADAAVTFDKVNELNEMYSAAKFYRADNESGEDTLFITNYAILDGGQTMGNLKTILTNMIAIGPAAREHVWGTGKE
jgi:hypothetical protein